MNFADYETPLSEVEQQVISWVEEALSLRHNGGTEFPPEGSAPPRYQETLLVIRQALDRTEYLLARLTRLRGRARRTAKEAKAAAENAQSQAFARMPRQEFQGAQERNSQASLASFTEQRLAIEAEKFQSTIEECYDVVKLCMDGLSSLRYDLVASLRGFQFESSLER